VVVQLQLDERTVMNLAKEQNATKEYLLVSDFDQTLSFEDSGHVLSDILEIPNFPDKVATLAKKHFVQQGLQEQA
jgi:hypothetical protein